MSQRRPNDGGRSGSAASSSSRVNEPGGRSSMPGSVTACRVAGGAAVGGDPLIPNAST